MQPSRHTSGILFAGTAFLLWGLLPMYWKALLDVPAFELLCHRIIWSVPFTALLLTLQGRWKELVPAFRDPKTMLLLLCSSSLIAMNWFIYIWAVNSGHVVETSLGYFINPLVNVLLGYLVFHDRLRPLQKLSVGFAAAGVAVSVAGYGAPPWISLGLAVSFALYGLVRKIVHIEALPGLFVETVLLGVPAAAWLIHLELAGTGALFSLSRTTDGLLIGAGVVTSIPLVLFAAGARRLPLTTLGVLQYLSPSCAFLLGVFLYHEPFTALRLAAFALIWAGVAVYMADGIMSLRKTRKESP